MFSGAGRAAERRGGTPSPLAGEVAVPDAAEQADEAAPSKTGANFIRRRSFTGPRWGQRAAYPPRRWAAPRPSML